MDLPRDLIELFSAFGDNGVRLLLVGGHAVAAHGLPRATKDVDLWLGPGLENIERACRALVAFGATRDIGEALRNAKPTDIVWLGRAPSRIDLLQSLPGVDFDQAWSRRMTVELGGAAISVIGKADLILNKRTVGRPQALRDVRALGGEHSRTTRMLTQRSPKRRGRS